MCATNDAQRHRRKQTHSLLADRVIFTERSSMYNCIWHVYGTRCEWRYEQTATLRDWRISWNPTSSSGHKWIAAYIFEYSLMYSICSEGPSFKCCWSFILHSLLVAFRADCAITDKWFLTIAICAPWIQSQLSIQSMGFHHQSSAEIEIIHLYNVVLVLLAP